MREELPEFADLLAGRTPAVAALARRLRGAALDQMPDLVERFYPGWQGLGWRQPDGRLLGTFLRTAVYEMSRLRVSRTPTAPASNDQPIMTSAPTHHCADCGYSLSGEIMICEAMGGSDTAEVSTQSPWMR